MRSVYQRTWVTLRYIFITHGHADHVLALEAVKAYFQVPVIFSRIDSDRLVHPELINERPYVTKPINSIQADILIQEADELWLDELQLRFYAMPGHTETIINVPVIDGNDFYSIQSCTSAVTQKER